MAEWYASKIEYSQSPNPPTSIGTPINFSDPDCAFDIRADMPGVGSVTWADVNLCAAKSVTLNRDASAGAWVDYDH